MRTCRLLLSICDLSPTCEKNVLTHHTRHVYTNTTPNLLPPHTQTPPPQQTTHHPNTHNTHTHTRSSTCCTDLLLGAGGRHLPLLRASLHPGRDGAASGAGVKLSPPGNRTRHPLRRRLLLLLLRADAADLHLRLVAPGELLVVKLGLFRRGGRRRPERSIHLFKKRGGRGRGRSKRQGSVCSMYSCLDMSAQKGRTVALTIMMPEILCTALK